MALKLTGRPALASGFDLVEGASLRVLYRHQEPVVGPRELRWEERLSDDDGRLVPQCGAFLGDVGKVPLHGTFSRPSQLLGDPGPLREGLIELAHPLYVRRRKAPAEALRQTGGEIIDKPLAVAGPLLALLFHLDDLAANEPVGVYHGRVDGPRDLGPGSLDDLGNALIERLLATVG
jgi:hypothetical protein